MTRDEFIGHLLSLESNPTCKSWISAMAAFNPNADRLSIRDVMVESDSRGYLMDYDDEDVEGEWIICHPYYIDKSLVRYYKLGGDRSYEIHSCDFEKFFERIAYTLSNEDIHSVKKRIAVSTKTKPAWVL